MRTLSKTEHEIPLTDALADFTLTAVPDEQVLHTARRALATALPLAIEAADRPAVRVLRRTLDRLQLPPAATIPGLVERTGVVHAPLLMGTAANLEDFDDTDLETLVHPSPAVVAAAITAAEHAGATLSTLLRSIALGLEVAVRVGRVLGESHSKRGWHISATSGSIGAGVAASAALGTLDREGVRRALSLVATQAAGFGAALGTMVKPLHFGRAASVAIEAALLAQAGFTAPATGLEGRRGFMSIMAPMSDATMLTHQLGTTWRATEIQAKPYPCGVVAHPAIDAALRLARRVTLTEDATIEARVHPSVIHLMGNVDPQTSLEAKLSAPHLLAVAMIRGVVDLSAVDPDSLADERIARLRRAVSLLPGPGPLTTAEILLTSGRVTSGEHVEEDSDSAPRSLSDQDVREKAIGLCSGRLGAAGSRRLVEAAFGSADLDVTTLLSMTVPKRAGNTAKSL